MEIIFISANNNFKDDPCLTLSESEEDLHPNVKVRYTISNRVLLMFELLTLLCRQISKEPRDLILSCVIDGKLTSLDIL